MPEILPKSQAHQEEPDSPRHWEFFQEFLDTVNSWSDYKFVITTKTKCQYVWYRYQAQPENGLKSLNAGTKYLVPATSEDMVSIAAKAEASLPEDIFLFSLPVVALGCYDNRSKIAKAIATYLTLQNNAQHRVETLHSTKVSITKPKEIISFIPELAQFPPELLALNLSKDDFLIWLFGQAEKDMLALHIGRACHLPQGGVMANETEEVAHSYRNVVILKGQPMVGKELPNSEPVLTPSGWVLNGTLKINDYVIGSNGLPTKVLGVYPQGLKDIYEITFSDNSVVRCGLEHLWTVTYRKALKKPDVKKQRYDCTRTITTEQLIRELKQYPNRHFSIPSFTGLKAGSGLCSEAWQLGYAYGNGCFTGGQFAVSCHAKDLDKVLKQFDSISNKPGVCRQTSENGYQINYPWASLPESFLELREQGLNKSLNTWVYQLCLEDQRKFFAGYFDADGSVCANSSALNFSCSNKILFDGFVSLGRSCGLLVTERLAIDNRGSNPSYRAQIVFPDEPSNWGFVIKQPLLPKQSANYKTFIKSVTKLDYQEESTCIEIEAKDSLYVTANYKLTHNTYFNNWIIQGLESCGLTTSVIHDLGKQFGHGQWVSSAWSYLDDTTEAMIGHFFNSSILKTVASNGLVNVEAKGVDHITVKAFTAPILLANNIDTRHLANCDEGNANRIKIVACKDLHSLKIAAQQLSPNSPLYGVESCIPAEIINHLTTKAKVTSEVLCMYFLRLCLDYFESFSMKQMAEKITALSQDLYAGYITNGINLLAKSAVLAHLLKNSLSLEDMEGLKIRYSEAGNSAPFILKSITELADLDSRRTAEKQGLIKNLIKHHWLKTGKDGGHPWVTHRTYSTYFLAKLGTIAETQMENLLRKGRDSVPLEKVYQTVFSELRDVDGNPSVYSISRIQDAWRAALVLNFEYILDVYRFVLAEAKALNQLEQVRLYRNSPMEYSAMFTSIADGRENPIEDIPDNYFMNYIMPSAEETIKWV